MKKRDRQKKTTTICINSFHFSSSNLHHVFPAINSKFSLIPKTFFYQITSSANIRCNPHFLILYIQIKTEDFTQNSQILIIISYYYQNQ